MFSDMKVVTEDLKSVEFVLTLHNSKKDEDESDIEFEGANSIPLPKVLGSRSNLKVLLPVPDVVFAMLPMGSSRSTSFTITPVFLNIGINEAASLAERFKSLEVQEQSNLANFARLVDYHRQYKVLALPVKYIPSKSNVTIQIQNFKEYYTTHNFG